MATPWTTTVKKMNLKFTYESRDTLRSFSLFLTVKTISKLNMEHSVKLTVKKFKNSPSSFTFARQRKVWSFHVVVLQRTQEIYKDL